MATGKQITDDYAGGKTEELPRIDDDFEIVKWAREELSGIQIIDSSHSKIREWSEKVDPPPNIILDRLFPKNEDEMGQRLPFDPTQLFPSGGSFSVLNEHDQIVRGRFLHFRNGLFTYMIIDEGKSHATQISIGFEAACILNIDHVRRYVEQHYPIELFPQSDSTITQGRPEEFHEGDLCWMQEGRRFSEKRIAYVSNEFVVLPFRADGNKEWLVPIKKEDLAEYQRRREELASRAELTESKAIDPATVFLRELSYKTAGQDEAVPVKIVGFRPGNDESAFHSGVFLVEMQGSLVLMPPGKLKSGRGGRLSEPDDFESFMEQADRAYLQNKLETTGKLMVPPRTGTCFIAKTRDDNPLIEYPLAALRKLNKSPEEVIWDNRGRTFNVGNMMNELFVANGKVAMIKIQTMSEFKLVTEEGENVSISKNLLEDQNGCTFQ